MMYRLMKIDLLDADPDADLFDEERYEELASGGSLEKILERALKEFKLLNPTYHSWSDWLKRAPDGAWEMEIFSDPPESLFRGSLLLRDKRMEMAVRLAMRHHGGRKRKGDGLEDMIHLLQITRLLEKRGFSGEIIAAAFCHDLLEDTKCSEGEILDACGPEVLRIVKAVSNDSALKDRVDWEKKKEKYVRSVLAGGEKAMAVCVADKIVNLRSLLAAYEDVGEALWSRFNRGKEQKLWFERHVLKSVKHKWKNPLVAEYAEWVNRFQLT